MAKPAKFAHVVYATKRFQEMIAWYQTVFEARVVYQNPLVAFLSYDEEHHRFAFVNLVAFDPSSDDGGQAGVGVNHVAHTYATVGDLMENYERLKQVGIRPYWAVHHGVTLSLYYRDLDGNRMEFQVDCCATGQEAIALMQSEAFAANPIGVALDPDALLEQYRNGAPAAQLLQQPVGPMSSIPPEHGLS